MTKHTTARGREFNMQAFAATQGGTIAVGNSNRNANGDLIGPGGKIIATADQIDIKTNATNKNASKKVKVDPSEYEIGRKDVVGIDGVTRIEIQYADGSVEIQDKPDQPKKQRTTEAPTPAPEIDMGELN